MRIGVGLKKHAYTPEAYAYTDYLALKGLDVQLAPENDLLYDNDLNIFFMGIKPFWSDKRRQANEIHEYQSLSTPPFAKTKDLYKRTINRRPTGRIFLNEYVEKQLGFNDRVPRIFRDMGVDQALFMDPPANPKFDLVYCGSINGRAGLLDELMRLAQLGLSVLVVGEIDLDTRQLFRKHSQVVFVGRVARSELPALYQEARAGLNFTPNIYPFNMQTSTKTLEYLAAGLGLVSNQYQWIKEFCDFKKIPVTWLENLTSKEDFESISFGCVDMASYSWLNVLDGAGFFDFITECAFGKQ
ncbi:glycosyltransferase family protein [Stutzerimonas nitrititolerans]|uniref:glycosyltransferase family protein n=1 Tax=Stutzerimonas nitrititolerans TaxID=2482751 RepID=UPI0028AC7D9F|nr:glycosyltransferase [Stutzerimonas nitrititolerans]